MGSRGAQQRYLSLGFAQDGQHTLALSLSLHNTYILSIDFLGKVVLPMSSDVSGGNGQDVWYELKPHAPADDVKGELKMVISVMDKKQVDNNNKCNTKRFFFQSALVFEVKPASTQTLTEAVGSEVIDKLPPKEKMKQEVK